MKIHVELFGTYRNSVKKYDPQKGLVLNVDSGITVEGLLEHFDARSKSPLVILNNERINKYNVILKDGDDIKIFSPVGGG